MRSPVASKAAHVEGVDDDGEPHGGAVQATEDKPADGNEGELPTFQVTLSLQDWTANSATDIPSLVHAREPPKGSQSRPQGPVRPPPTSLGEVPHSKDQAGQKQSKNRSKRGPPPRIPRESEPPFGSLRNAPSSIYEEAIDTLRKMSPADTARLKNVVLNQMAAEGFPMPTEDPRPKRMQGTSYPMRSIVNPPWVPSMRKKDIMTEGEAENLRRALLDKIDKSVEQDWAAPIAKALEELKSQKSATTLQTIGGNVDGASQSVEIVAPEKEAATGKQATIVQPKKEEGPETVRPLLATDCENKLTSLPHDGKYQVSISRNAKTCNLIRGVQNTLQVLRNRSTKRHSTRELLIRSPKTSKRLLMWSRESKLRKLLQPQRTIIQWRAQLITASVSLASMTWRRGLDSLSRRLEPRSAPIEKVSHSTVASHRIAHLRTTRAL